MIKGDRMEIDLRRSPAFRAAVERYGAQQAAEALRAVLPDAVSNAQRLVQQEMVTDRPGDRRKSGGHARKLDRSFDADIEWDGVGFPMYLVVSSKDNIRKVMSLEKGSSPHWIFPTNGEFLSFPRTAGRSAHMDLYTGDIVRHEGGRSTSPRARQAGYSGARGARGGKGRWVKTPNGVFHPGNRPYRFMQRAAEQALRKALSKL